MKSKKISNTTLILCNVCGKEIKLNNGILKEDVFEASKEWGFFSNRDLEVHHFNICESCYENMIENFKIPVTIMDKREVL
ncbi:MAG TPA: hypothetical protein GXZ90_08835 [Clostridiales bacterium]|nr:hypothetical protein [Clostridiales bacterium]